MNRLLRATGIAAILAVAFGVPRLLGQGSARPASQGSAAADAHYAAAKAAAGTDFVETFERVCDAVRPPNVPSGAGSAANSPNRAVPGDRSTWYAEPVKVFDNLYFLGQSEYSVWAVTTSQGIILIDTIFDYSVEAEVTDGLRKMGLDPKQIKYAIVSHAHNDHSGGAKYLQDTYGARIVLSAEDWDLLERSTGPKPKRDIVAADGMKLTLGNTTITMYITPGHTLGTLSTVIPVVDNGRPHVAVALGGNLFNWLNNNGRGYITPERPASFWFRQYIDSSRRFREIAKQNGADIAISNHTIYDGSKRKLPAVLARKPGQPNPYVIGEDAVQRYLTIFNECAQAGLARIN